MSKLDDSLNSLAVGIRKVFKQTHAGVALSGAALVDQALEVTLVGRMPQLNRAMHDKLFQGYGPLSSFSAKIDVAFALALLDKRTHAKLSIVRKIRNEFAHSSEPLSFESPVIMSLLSLARNPGEDPGEDSSDGRTFYLSLLAGSVERLKDAPAQTKAFLESLQVLRDQ